MTEAYELAELWQSFRKAEFLAIDISYTVKIWNRTRPRALMQNQHTRELISARKTSHKHNQPLRMYLWWSLRTLYKRLQPCHVRVTVRGFRLLLLCLCDGFRALINSLVRWPCTLKARPTSGLRWGNLWPCFGFLTQVETLTSASAVLHRLI